MRAAAPDWAGRTVFCIASGPSLTAEDCEAVRAAGHPAIVTNSTFRLVPWAAVLLAYDSRWWKTYLGFDAKMRRVNPDEIRDSGFAGRLICASPIAPNLGVETLHNATWLRNYPNTGACAIAIAIGGRAERVILLGYDCAPAPDGRMHWHADHPPLHGMTNCASIAHWPKHFKNVARDAERAGIEVVNASRETRLRCFQRLALPDLL